MEFLLNSTPAHILLGLGIACLCGFRAFLPLFLLALAIRFDLLGAPDVTGTWAAFLQETWGIVTLGALALVEMILDKLVQPGRTLDFLLAPLRSAAGGLAFATALSSAGLVAVIVAAVVGAGVTFIGRAAHGGLRSGAEETAGAQNRAFISLFEDVAVAVGTAAVIAFPFLGLLLFLFVLFLVYRVRVRRRRKYKGLRSLR